MDLAKVSVSFVPPSTAKNPSPLPVLMHGEPVKPDEERASEILGEEDFTIVVDLGGQGVGGKQEAKYWTCDFSYVSDQFPLGIRMLIVWCPGLCEDQWGIPQLITG